MYRYNTFFFLVFSYDSVSDIILTQSNKYHLNTSNSLENIDVEQTFEDKTLALRRQRANTEPVILYLDEGSLHDFTQSTGRKLFH